MATIKVKYLPAKIQGEKGKIYYQISHRRMNQKLFTDYTIFNNEWDNKENTIILSKNIVRNMQLDSIIKRIRCETLLFERIVANIPKNQDNISVIELKNEFIIQLGKQSLYHFMETIIARLRDYGKQRTSETYQSALNSIRRYRNKVDIMFNEIDSDLMQSYQAYLVQNGLIPNTISFYMRILRAVYNRAVEAGITDDKKPFRHVYTGIDKTIKRALDIATLKKIKEIDLSSLPSAEFARDLFLLSFYLRGMSYVDMAFLRKSDIKNGYLIYRRRKTGQQLTIRWKREMQEIIDKFPRNETEYLLPIITNKDASPYNQYRAKQFKINKGLKTVAKLIGSDIPLSMYYSRHSWASLAKLKGVPIGVISEGLGHDNELTTQIYLASLDTSAVDNANDLIINSI